MAEQEPTIGDVLRELRDVESRLTKRIDEQVGAAESRLTKRIDDVENRVLDLRRDLEDHYGLPPAEATG